FFFQAEDGIRDLIVTGVQTCALPIFEGVHGVAHDAEVAARGAQLDALDAEQALLETELVAGVAGEAPRGADHAMARYDDRQRVQIGRASCRERVCSSGVAVVI